ncbi:DUF3055 domain-containing protein [Brevibacillus fluminis]|uniref:DUF3055 domain-containing protein n=1 Tax=Brevibacillus fluminis TaxID=511487 RepID=UPI0016059DF4|nr:DUF3055 domain-containing protein [Brevibacillus fluminis]
MHVEQYESLYDLSESAQVRFIGVVSEHTRYDFGIVYTSRFFGKPLVVCMQTGQSALLGSDDAHTPGTLQRVFRLTNENQAVELSKMLLELLPALPMVENQY